MSTAFEPPFPLTYPANRLIQVRLMENSPLRHPLGAIVDQHGRTAVYPVTYPVLTLQKVVRATHSLTDKWFVIDIPTGRPLPIIAMTSHSGRAAAEAWNAAVRRRLANPADPSGVDPLNPASALEWADRFVTRSPAEVQVELHHKVQWPPHLPPSPYA